MDDPYQNTARRWPPDGPPFAKVEGDDAVSTKPRSRAQEGFGSFSRIGSVVDDRWTIDEKLGSGGMADVYAATHRTGYRVAIKVLRRQLAFTPSLVERFRREGYVANRLGHKGTVTVLDDGELPDGSPYLVMDLLDGESLADKLKHEGALPWPTVLAVAHTALEVLAAAHKQGILHLDIKPANIFLTESGDVKVLDFGIAKLLDGEHGGLTSTTTTGTIMGTAAFMAPEQARGERASLDGRADLFSLAATLYMLATGKHIHLAPTTDNESLLFAATVPCPSVRSMSPGIPEALALWLDRALSFDKADRFPDAASMQDALCAAESHLPHLSMRAQAVRDQKPPAPSRSRRLLLAAAAGSFSLAAAVTAIGVRVGMERSTQPDIRVLATTASQPAGTRPGDDAIPPPALRLAIAGASASGVSEVTPPPTQSAAPVVAGKSYGMLAAANSGAVTAGAAGASGGRITPRPRASHPAPDVDVLGER